MRETEKKRDHLIRRSENLSLKIFFGDWKTKRDRFRSHPFSSECAPSIRKAPLPLKTGLSCCTVGIISIFCPLKKRDPSLKRADSRKWKSVFEKP
ncbi:hypothetical protein CEXT_772111 [Caerostris extrusa]|uniref:Uncharacterized protein n=1 Tax=Caerostris extrusa TaxID=172846 RepID=A0AAV4XIG6_CAEEX|nr:hypothetical protein CEXT_772111 [Caerostris extrusa]